MEENNEGLEPLESPIENDVTPSELNAIIQEDDNEFEEIRANLEAVIEECGKVLVSQDDIVELMLAALICDGHVLLEGVPGVAKTLTAKVFARTLDAGFSRIQFTPDLMPSDIIGTSIFNTKTSTFDFKQGPVFSNIVLIDEINRAPAKTQAALFEVMEEKQISYDGMTYKMGFPFMIVATQNPVEQEGTYRLPEAQLDRFLMKINIEYLHPNDELLILKRFKDNVGRPDLSIVQHKLNALKLQSFQEKTNQVHVSEQLMNYIISIISETRGNNNIYLGASPRAALALLKTSVAMAMIKGRKFVIPDDIQFLVPYVLGHRIILTPEAEVSGKNPSSVLREILEQIEVPR